MSEDVKVAPAPPLSETAKDFRQEYAPYRHVLYKICKNCGKIFIMSDNDVVHFVKKFGTVPVRCSECRADRRVYFDTKVETTTEQKGENK